MNKNLLGQIEAVLDGETVTGFSYGSQTQNVNANLLEWNENTKQLLNVDYEQNYGDCYDLPTFYVWTETRVIFLRDYDGWASVQSLPCRPNVCVPNVVS